MGEWWENRMVALDFETTAADPEQARVVSATLAFVGAGEPSDIYSWVVNPGVEIPEEAQAIHGLSTEHVREHGVDPLVMLYGVVEGLRMAHSAGFVVVAFNTPYDLTVLDRELRRLGYGPCEEGLALIPKLKVIDPLVIDRHLDRYRAGKRTLTATCETLRVKFDGAHDAAYDAIAAARLAYRIGKDGRVVRRAPRCAEEGDEQRALYEEWALIRSHPDLLHVAQRRWALAQQEHLEEYFHKGNPKKGVPPQPDRRVPRGWPWLPVSDSADTTPSTPTLAECQ